MVLDGRGVVLELNRAAEQLLGQPAGRVRGRRLGFPAELRRTTEVILLRPDGGQVVAEARLESAEWEGGAAWLLCMRDRTRRRWAEDLAAGTDVDHRPRRVWGSGGQFPITHLSRLGPEVTVVELSDDSSGRRIAVE